MNEGKCGIRSYGNIDQNKIDMIMSALQGNGATISGSNPWEVDTHNFGVKLQGSWDPESSTMSIIVMDKNFMVPCSKIWEIIEPLISEVSGLDH